MSPTALTPLLLREPQGLDQCAHFGKEKRRFSGKRMKSKALSRAVSALSLELLTVVGGSGMWHSPDQSLDRNRSPVSKPGTGPGSSNAHKDLDSACRMMKQENTSGWEQLKRLLHHHHSQQWQSGKIWAGKAENSAEPGADWLR